MTELTSKSDNVKNGITFGLIIGLIYCISLFLRYNMLSSGPIMFAVVACLFYLVVIGMLFFCIAKRRKELGGFINLKDAFQTVFIAILIAEFIYIAFNVIYLKFIDPHFFEKFQASMETFIENSSMSETKKEETLNKFKEQMSGRETNALTAKGIILGYLTWVAITGVFGFIAALIMRKRKPVFDELDQPRQ